MLIYRFFPCLLRLTFVISFSGDISCTEAQYISTVVSCNPHCLSSGFTCRNGQCFTSGQMGGSFGQQPGQLIGQGWNQLGLGFPAPLPYGQNGQNFAGFPPIFGGQNVQNFRGFPPLVNGQTGQNFAGFGQNFRPIPQIQGFTGYPGTLQGFQGQYNTRWGICPQQYCQYPADNRLQRPQAPDGSQCLSSTDCMSFYCNNGFCTRIPGRSNFNGLTYPLGSNLGQITSYPGTSLALQSAVSSDSKQAGEDLVPGGSPCTSDHKCFSGTCISRVCSLDSQLQGKVAGRGVCLDNSQCFSNVCCNGRCATDSPVQGKVAPGGCCVKNHQCLSGNCNQNVCA